jgi:4'-phosphopantetheinyl transferase
VTSAWQPTRRAPALAPGHVHVWRIPLDRPADEVRALRSLLDDDERRRADRFYAEAHRVRFTVAHARLREILAGYTGEDAPVLRFTTGAHGKPSPVAGESGRGVIPFNLSHSGDLALVAVAAEGDVGVDVERHDGSVEFLAVAERFFSPNERAVLRGLAHDGRALTHAFFAAWSRKEAYLKATGHGITRGLHHFDVSCAPDVPARLLDDRMDGEATTRWAMTSFVPAAGYSGALVAAAPLAAVVLLELGDAP